MNKIRNAFEDRKAFIAYLTAGDPDLETTKELILTMEQTGVDVIEIGIPSENIPVELSELQESNRRGIEAGTTAEDVFNMILSLNKTVRVPLVVLAYLDTIREYGISRFMRKCKECSVEGLIVPDLVYEERNEISRDCDLFGVDLLSIIHPSSRDEIATIAKKAKGFIYCESSPEKLGQDNEVDYSEMVAIIRGNGKVPCAMGFGITTPDQAKNLARIGDGVVIASGILRTIEEYGKNCVVPVREYIRTMKAALRQA